MKIVSSRFGELEFDKSKIILFPEGIPGFHNFKNYILLKKEDNDIFWFLHSIENKDLMFILTNPYFFIFDYSFQISDEDLKILNVNKEETNHITTMVITKIDRSKNIYLNLKAPICINTSKKIGKQIILYKSKYSHQFKLELQNLTANKSAPKTNIKHNCLTLIKS